MAGRARHRRVRHVAGAWRTGRRGLRVRHPRRAGSGSSGAAGLIGLGWPVEHGGRGATLGAADHLGRGVRRGPRRRPREPHGREPAGPDAHRATARPSSGRGSCPPILRRRGALVPGLQRARTPAPTSPTCRPGRCSTATSGCSPVRRSGPRSPTCRTGASWSPARIPASARHAGLSFLLVPMDQPGVEVRPIVQITGGGEFNEVFFDGARTGADLVVGEVGEGWRVAMGAARLRARRVDARPTGRLRARARPRHRARPRAASVDDPVVRQRLVDAWIGLQLMRWNAHALACRRAACPAPEASISKLFWGTWHRELGELGDGSPRRRGVDRRDAARTSSRSNRSSSCSPGPTRSTAARTRSSATCSASACWACRASRRRPQAMPGRRDPTLERRAGGRPPTRGCDARTTRRG